MKSKEIYLEEERLELSDLIEGVDNNILARVIKMKDALEKAEEEIAGLIKILNSKGDVISTLLRIKDSE